MAPKFHSPQLSSKSYLISSLKNQRNRQFLHVLSYLGKKSYIFYTYSGPPKYLCRVCKKRGSSFHGMEENGAYSETRQLLAPHCLPP